MGGDSGRAGVSVALQRLDAAEREHEPARGDDEIGAEADGPGNLGGFDQLARGNHANAALQIVLDQLVGQQRQRFFEGQAHVVDEALWRRSGTAVGAVQCDEVRCGLLTAPVDLREQRVEEFGCTKDHLEAGRFACDVADALDHVEEVFDRVDVGVSVRTDRVLTNADAAVLRDLGSDLGGGQDAAFARLGALTELQLEHPHLLVSGQIPELVIRELAVEVADAVFCRSDLDDQVRAAFEVLGGQAAFPRVHPAASHPGPFGKCQHCGLRDGAVAYARDVENGRRDVGRAGVGTDHQGLQPG